MMKTALFIRHQAQPNKRDEVQRIWEKHVKPRVQENAAHEAYFYCFDDNDADGICVFQLYTDQQSAQQFTTGDWYDLYLNEVMHVVKAPPQISTTTLVWGKGFS